MTDHEARLDAYIHALPDALAGRDLRGARARVLLCVDGGACYLLVLENGEASVQTPVPPDAVWDTEVSAAAPVLLDLIAGRANPAASLLLRRVRVSGDAKALLALVARLSRDS